MVPGGAAWQQPQLSAPVMETAAAAGDGTCDRLLACFPSSPACSSGTFLSHSPGDRARLGAGGPGGTGSAICPLPKGQASSCELAIIPTRGISGVPIQGSHSPSTVHPTQVVASLGRSPLSSPCHTGRYCPQLGGDIVVLTLGRQALEPLSATPSPPPTLPRRRQSPGGHLSPHTPSLQQPCFDLSAISCPSLLVLAGPGPEPACTPFALRVRPPCCRIPWGFSGPGVGKALLQPSPKARRMFRGRQGTSP